MIQVWKDPASDALRIQYDGADGPIYEVPDGYEPGPEVDDVPYGWVELIEAPSEHAIPVSKLRALASHLEVLAETGRFFTPTRDEGELKAGAQALADSAARILQLAVTGSFR